MPVFGGRVEVKMNQTVQKIVRALGGKKNAGIYALFIIVGIALTFVGTADRTGFNFDTGAGAEKKIERLCEKVCPPGDIYVSVNTSHSGEVTGIAVVCSRGSDPSVRLTVTEMLGTLFSLPSSKIYVTDFG